MTNCAMNAIKLLSTALIQTSSPVHAVFLTLIYKITLNIISFNLLHFSTWRFDDRSINVIISIYLLVQPLKCASFVT